MKGHIVVSDFTPNVGDEWNWTAYPGPGIYETSIGLAVVFGAPQMITMVTMHPRPEIIRKPQQELQTAGAVDVHRLFDQLIQLKG